MAKKFLLQKTKNYPRPHHLSNVWTQGLESGQNDRFIPYPSVMYDEGLGDPSGYNANPEHASFAKYQGPNCYPESFITDYSHNIKVSMTKGALHTDNLDAIRFAVMVQAVQFLDDLTAQDELSGDTIEDILELQHETVDRQCYPLFNGIDTTALYGTSDHVGSDIPGLTTDANLEGASFSVATYYNMVQYGAIAPKLKKVQTGLKWYTLTRDRPIKNIKIHLKNKAKKMHPYTLLNPCVYVPQVDTILQIPSSGDTTNIPHVRVAHEGRYLEWNQNFDMGRQ